MDLGHVADIHQSTLSSPLYVKIQLIFLGIYLTDL